MVGVAAEQRWHALVELAFHRQRRLARRQAAAVADPEDMGVDRIGRLAKRHVEHHVGGLAANTGQGLQRLALARHLAAVLVHQDGAGLQQVLGLVAVQADGADLLGHGGFAQRQHLLRRAGQRKQPPGGLVDADIGGLGRQQHRGQQLEDRGVFQLAGRLRVGGGQRGKKRFNLGGFHRHRALAFGIGTACTRAMHSKISAQPNKP